jgi:hypothetical protein
MTDSEVELFVEIWSLIEANTNSKLKQETADAYVKLLDNYGYDMSEPDDFFGQSKYLDKALKQYLDAETNEEEEEDF